MLWWQKRWWWRRWQCHHDKWHDNQSCDLSSSSRTLCSNGKPAASCWCFPWIVTKKKMIIIIIIIALINIMKGVLQNVALIKLLVFPLNCNRHHHHRDWYRHNNHYCCDVSIPSTQSYLNKIRILQNKLLRSSIAVRLCNCHYIE